VVAAIVAAPVLAQADPEAPAFVTLGPDGIATQAGADLALVRGTGNDATVERIALAGQIVGAGGVGGYLALAGAHGAGVATGGLDLGGSFRGHASGLDVTMRAGLSLPTSLDYDYDDGGAAQRDGTVAVHPADVATTPPGVTSLRVAVSPSYQHGRGFLRLELGIDAAVGGDLKEDAGTTVHAEIAVGFVRRRLAATLELSNVRYHVVHEYDRMLGLAATVQYRTGRWLPYAGLAGLFGRDDLSDPYVSVIAGVRMRFEL
jgi:hypothetical protein